MKNYKYILSHSSGNLTTEYNPVNWNNLNIVFRRSKKYRSVLRRQILDSEFPKDGKTYIDNIVETYGIDTQITCEIQYLDKSDFSYATLFDGIIDLSEWAKLRDTTTVKIADATILSKFMTRDDTVISINRATDLDGNAVSSYTYLNQMTVDGVDTEEKAEYSDDANEIAITTVQTGVKGATHEYYGVSDDGFDFNTVGADADLPDETLVSASGPIYTNNGASNQKVRFRVITAAQGTVATAGSSTWEWGITAYTGKNGATTAFDRQQSGSGGGSSGITESYDSGYIEETLAPGETIEIYHDWYYKIDAVGDTITPNFTIEPTHVEIYTITDGEPATAVNMPLTHELVAKVLEIITGQSDPLNSSILGRTDSEPRTYGSDGDFSLIGAASGYMLRGFPHSQQPFTTTFADCFKSIDAIANIGLWWDAANNEFQIKPIAEFFKVSKIITLGEVEGLEETIATDEYFNEVSAGYAKEVEYEELNGQQNFNVQTVFANDGLRIKNTKDIRSQYRGDDYGIELSRQSQYSDTAGEDTRYDTDNFWVNGQRSGGNYRTIQGTFGFTDVSGVYSPDTRLNLDITAKRNMLRHGSILSIPQFISQGVTRFMRSQFNLALSTQKSGEPSAIVETDDVAYSDLDEPLFYPVEYNFTAPLEDPDVLQLISDPHGYVEFDYLGVTYSGYIVEVSSEPFNRRGNWTLLKRNPNRV